MHLFDKSLEAVTKDDVAHLIENAVTEDRFMDYKQERPGTGDEEKGKFLADVAAFANGSGGHVLYGIEEQRDSDGKPTGIPSKCIGLASFNFDAERRRLLDIMDSGLDPKLPPGSIEFAKIDGFDRGPLLLLRIRRSWAGPHRIKQESKLKNCFYLRDSGRNRQLDTMGIRELMLATDGIPERIEAFRKARVERIINKEGPSILLAGGKLIVHLIPLSAVFSPSSQIDIAKASDLLGRRVALPLYSQADETRKRINIDGIVLDSPMGKEQPATNSSYLQLFRSGAIESVEAYLLSTSRAKNSPVIHLKETSKIIGDAVPKYLSLLQELGVPAPFVLAVTLTGVRNLEVAEGQDDLRRLTGSVPYFDRDNVALPHILIGPEDLSTPAHLLLEPLLHSLWQSGGMERCPLYK